MPYIKKCIGPSKTLILITQCRHSADECHGDGEVEVTVEKDAPEVGASSSWTTAEHEEAQPEELVIKEKPADTVRELENLASGLTRIFVARKLFTN